MNYFQGLVACFFAAIAFGIQYVPVKRYEIYDGITFQWFMCAGILFFGFAVGLVTGDYGLEGSDSNLIVLGGALWAISNYAVLPLVKLLGIGLGFSLYHFVNLIVSYIIGRFGLFGVNQLKGNFYACDAGCFLVLISFMVLVFVEGSEGEEVGEEPLPAPPPEMEISVTSEATSRAHTGSHVSQGRGDMHHTNSFDRSVGGFAVVSNAMAKFGGAAEPGEFLRGTSDQWRPGALEAGDGSPGAAQPTGSVPLVTAQVGPQDTQSSAPMEEAGMPVKPVASTLSVKFLGVLLALVAGGLAGIQSVPAVLYNQKRPDASPMAAVFPQCLGTYIAASLIYVVYSCAAKLSGRSVPHSNIRPAYLSGCIWAAGFTGMVSGISALGFSLGYMLDAVGPIMVASLLSIFVFREIVGFKQIAIYSAAFSLQLVGVGIMTAFSEHSS
eukprot:TRINITY_DN31870_c0_g1_i1.p1 TRINITY_DN31870_c0_g1~~TRINITY_DN31870_c0_g1_i1.p1  ORF type:complete len:439 (-),score=68.62 TRINITY_DN31870_c0_g1_i1:233-1549(-)